MERKKQLYRRFKRLISDISERRKHGRGTERETLTEKLNLFQQQHKTTP